jgi:hypothetical protein
MSGGYADAFRKTVEEEQAAVKAEQEQRRLVKEAAARQLKEARRAAQAVRDGILQPMLNSLCETFKQGKVLPHWEVKLADDGNQFYVLLTALREAGAAASPRVGWGGKPERDDDDVSISASRGPHESWKKLSIRAGISVVDGGPSLSMAVLLPKELGESHPGANTKDIVEVRDGQCDESTVTIWYQARLEDCARRVVRFAAEEQKP